MKKSITLVLAALVVILLLVLVYVFLRKTEKFESMPTMKYFYLPTCGWCQKFTPVWDQFENKVQEEKLPVITKKIDASLSENSAEVEKENIRGFPHVMLEKGDKKVEFQDERSVDSLLTFVKSNL